MGVTEIYTTLHDFLVEWLTNRVFRDEYDGDLESALEHHGFHDVDPETLLACLPLVAEDLPLVYQQAIYDYMNTASDVDSGSQFEVNQGGSPGGGHGGGHGGMHHPAEAAAVESQQGGEPIDEVIRHVYNIQNVAENNYSYIDDSGDVTTTVTALGDVDLDQVLATGDGAVAADGDVEGVNTGVNNGVIAGEDADDVEVTNVTGDRNVTGELGDATVVTGDDNVLAKDSTVVDGDVEGTVVGGDVDADHSALNFGDGKIKQDNSVDNSVDLDLDVTDSFQDNSDHSLTDKSYTDKSYTDKSVDTDLDVDIDEAFNKDVDHDTTFEADKSFNTTEVDLDLDEVELD